MQGAEWDLDMNDPCPTLKLAVTMYYTVICKYVHEYLKPFNKVEWSVS